MSYPILYAQNETNFEHLGMSVLSDATKCLVTKERNGIYILEMDYPINGKDVNLIKEGLILKVDTGYRSKNQRFIISQITKKKNKSISVYAKHISQVKTTMNAIKPNVTASGSAYSALEMWRSNLLIDKTEFSVWSDITTYNSTTWDIENIENAREALGGTKGSILDVWGGEYEFDNLDIKLHKQMGRDSSIIIAYGRNLIDLEQEKSILETYTSIYPFKKLLDGDNETLITLPEYFVHSEHVNLFQSPRVLKIDFSSDENIKTVDQLRNEAIKYIRNNSVGVPKVSLKIKYQDLSKVKGIFDNNSLEEIDLCDTAKVYFEELGIMNETAKVSKIVWDVILDENHEIEIGDTRTGLTDTILGNRFEEVDNQVKRFYNSISAQIDRQAEEQHLIYDRKFKEKSKELETSIKNGIEQLKAKNEENAHKLKTEIENTLSTEIRNNISSITENFNANLDATKRDLLSATHNTIADYKQTIDGQVAIIKGIADNGLRRVVMLSEDLNGLRSSVSSLDNDTLKKADVDVTADGILLGAGKVVDGNKLASLISVKPEAVSILTDKMIITSANMNLVKSEFRNTSHANNAAISIVYTGEAREFLIKGYVGSGIVSGNPFFIDAYITHTDGTKRWSSRYKNFGIGAILTGTFVITSDKQIQSIQFHMNVTGTGNSAFISNLEIIPKTNAIVIENGSITGDQLKFNSVTTSHIQTGSITSSLIQTDAITSNHLKVDQAMINKLMVNDLLTNSLFARQAFINKLKAIDIDATRITTGLLRARNGNMTINMLTGETEYSGSASIRFYSSGNTLHYQNGTSRAFLNFNDAEKGGAAAVLGVNSGGNFRSDVPYFAGIKVFRNSATQAGGLLDQIDVVADTITIKGGYNERNGIYIDTTRFSGINLYDVLKSFRDNIKQLHDVKSTAKSYDWELLNL